MSGTEASASGQEGVPTRSSRRHLVADCEAGLLEPLFEQRKPVVAPERFAREQEERHAEHVIRGGLRLTAVVSLAALPGQIFEIVPIGEANIRNQSSHGLRLIGFELAKKEFLEGCA